jgi:large subunit ribosomal protein L23
MRSWPECLKSEEMQQILIKPLITEKMSLDTERRNAYGFVVADGANKIEIKKAIEKEYGVTVTSVRTLRVDGKQRQRYTKTGMVKGRTNGYKKAIVSIGDGELIDFYENI